MCLGSLCIEGNGPFHALVVIAALYPLFSSALIAVAGGVSAAFASNTAMRQGVRLGLALGMCAAVVSVAGCSAGGGGNWNLLSIILLAGLPTILGVAITAEAVRISGHKAI